jgi:hypothetical protein
VSCSCESNSKVCNHAVKKGTDNEDWSFNKYPACVVNWNRVHLIGNFSYNYCPFKTKNFERSHVIEHEHV